MRRISHRCRLLALAVLVRLSTVHVLLDVMGRRKGNHVGRLALYCGTLLISLWRIALLALMRMLRVLCGVRSRRVSCWRCWRLLLLLLVLVLLLVAW